MRMPFSVPDSNDVFAESRADTMFYLPFSKAGCMLALNSLIILTESVLGAPSSFKTSICCASIESLADLMNKLHWLNPFAFSAHKFETE